VEKSLYIVGAGRAGLALGVAARAAGWSIAKVWSRSEAHARDAGERLGCGYAAGPRVARCQDAQLVLLAVVDDAIAATAREVARWSRADQLVLHVSGSVESRLLEQEGVKGSCGSLHPLAALPDVRVDGNASAIERLRACFVAIEGAPEALLAASALADDLGARRVTLRRDGKSLYHAGAVVLSNYLVTLFDAALELFGLAGIAPDDAQPMLAALAQSALDNLSKNAPSDALTGPIRRGDVDVVGAHLAALASLGPSTGLEELYRALMPRTLQIAQKSGVDPALFAALLPGIKTS